MRDIPKINFGGGEMSPSTYSRVDLAKFSSGASKIENFFVEAEGGVTNRMGSLFIKPSKDETKVARLIPFVFNEQQSYALEFGDQYMRVFVAGEPLFYQTAETITGVTQANPAQVTSTAHGYSTGDEIKIDNIVGMTELNGMFYTITVIDANNYTLNGVDSTSFNAYVSGGASIRIFEIVTPYLEAELPDLKYRQSNDIVYFAHVNHDPRKLSRLDIDNWTLNVINFEPKQDPVTNLAVTQVGSGGSATYSYRVTAVAEETAEESIVEEVTTNSGNAALSNSNFNRISWDAAAGAEEYNVYKDENGLYGFIGTTESLQFDDTNYAPNLEDTSPKLRQPFNGADNKPGTVGLHEERSWWGGTNNDPLALYSSQTGNFENTNVSSPTRSTDAVTVRLTSGKGNELRHLRSFRSYLFLFTSGAVWTIGPGGDSDAISPASKELKVQEWLGSTQVPPLTIKTNLLMVAGRARVGYEVHQIGQDIQSGAAGDYTGSDLTVLSRHLFRNFNILEWCYIERPYRLVLAVRDDGKILCMTYMNEHQIYAWVVWDMGGIVESICSVPQEDRDVAYMIIKRTVNGQTRRYVEYLNTREYSEIEDAYFVDAGIQEEYGSPTSIITGLDHLEGEEIYVLGDGDIYKGTVTNGQASLPDEVSKVSAGLGYRATMRTLPLNAAPETIAKRKNVKNVVIRTLDTRGIFAGPSGEELEEYPSRFEELWGDPAAPISDMVRIPIGGDWERSRTVTVASDFGLPCTIQSVIPDFGNGNT